MEGLILKNAWIIAPHGCQAVHTPLKFVTTGVIFLAAGSVSPDTRPSCKGMCCQCEQSSRTQNWQLKISNVVCCCVVREVCFTGSDVTTPSRKVYHMWCVEAAHAHAYMRKSSNHHCSAFARSLVALESTQQTFQTPHQYWFASTSCPWLIANASQHATKSKV